MCWEWSRVQKKAITIKIVWLWSNQPPQNQQQFKREKKMNPISAGLFCINWICIQTMDLWSLKYQDVGVKQLFKLHRYRPRIKSFSNRSFSPSWICVYETNKDQRDQIMESCNYFHYRRHFIFIVRCPCDLITIFFHQRLLVVEPYDC